MRIFLISLGCARNLVDSEFVLDVLSKEGYDIVDKVSDADVAIVNTCGFIEDAKREAIDIILDLVKIKEEKDLKVVAGGCFTQRYSKDILEEIPELDAIIGINWDNIVEVIENLKSGQKIFNVKEDRYLLNYPVQKKFYLSPKHFAYLKISEGCSHRCSYCAIYGIKGPYRSRPMDDIIKEAEFLLKRGVKELNIVAQDTTSYGRDGGFKVDIVGLLEKLNAVEGDFWIRLLYAHPKMVTEPLISAFNSLKKLCKYIDLPLQHINSRILKEMNRPSSKEKVYELIDSLRSRIPDLAIRTSLIVGFPSESEDEFKELIDFIRDVKFERLGCFRYSQEEGTAAFDLKPQIAEDIKDKRFDIIMETQNSIAKELNARLIGKELKVLTEEEEEERYYISRSEFDAPEVDGVVYIRKNKRIEPGDFVNVRIEDVLDYDLIAEAA
jgi:ribosomal protein S12 methylthiotransferase